MSSESPAIGESDTDRDERARRRRIREFLDRSRSGAPAAGEAIRDRFSGDEVFERVVATASYEFSCSDRQLFLSGLAAGLSITLSFLTRATVVATIPGPAGEALSYLLYPIGFVFIVIGGYQLFTENTLTPVTLVLTRIASVPLLFRVWGIVLAANLLGAVFGAFLLADTPIFGRMRPAPRPTSARTRSRPRGSVSSSRASSRAGSSRAWSGSPTPSGSRSPASCS